MDVECRLHRSTPKTSLEENHGKVDALPQLIESYRASCEGVKAVQTGETHGMCSTQHLEARVAKRGHNKQR